MGDSRWVLSHSYVVQHCVDISQRLGLARPLLVSRHSLFRGATRCCSSAHVGASGNVARPSPMSPVRETKSLPKTRELREGAVERAATQGFETLVQWTACVYVHSIHVCACGACVSRAARAKCVHSQCPPLYSCAESVESVHRLQRTVPRRNAAPPFPQGVSGALVPHTISRPAQVIPRLCFSPSVPLSPCLPTEAHRELGSSFWGIGNCGLEKHPQRSKPTVGLQSPEEP